MTDEKTKIQDRLFIARQELEYIQKTIEINKILNVQDSNELEKRVETTLKRIADLEELEKQLID